MTPRQALSFSNVSSVLTKSWRNSRLRLFTGGLLNFRVATPENDKE